MKSFEADRARDGDVATLNEFNAEAREVLSVVNGGIDRDNINAPLERAKLRIGAITAVMVRGFETERAVTHQRSDTRRNDVFPMPDHLGNPWVDQFLSGDGLLDMSVGATWRMGAPDDQAIGDVIWIGLRLDGEIVVQSPFSDPASWSREHAFAKGKVPVGPGVHTIEVVYGGPIAAFPPAFAEEVVTWRDRMFSIRECAR